MRRAPIRAALCLALTLLWPGDALAAGAGAAERWQAIDGRDDWQWDARSVRGPDGWRCGAPRHQLVRMDAPDVAPALGVDAAQAAARLRALGVSRPPALTHRIACDDVVLYRVPVAFDRALLIAPGRAQAVRRLAIDDGPLATVQSLLLGHVGATTGVSSLPLPALSRWLSPSLLAAIRLHRARPRARFAVPAVPFDPFTGADEVPSRLALETPVSAGGVAMVTLHAVLEGAAREDHRATLVLRRTGGRWLVDDVRYLDGDITLKALLAR